jgi:hypothetical protein
MEGATDNAVAAPTPEPDVSASSAVEPAAAQPAKRLTLVERQAQVAPAPGVLAARRLSASAGIVAAQHSIFTA